jgi:hypothetical protein
MKPPIWETRVVSEVCPKCSHALMHTYDKEEMGYRKLMKHERQVLSEDRKEL